MFKFGTYNPNIPQLPLQKLDHWKAYIFKISLTRSLYKII